MSTTHDTELRRMSHASDPDTSHTAARKAKRGRKVAMIHGAILGVLAGGPLTAKEIHTAYTRQRSELHAWLPEADLQDIRRRLTELQHDTHRVVDTKTRRNGERVMALAQAVAA